MKPYGSRRTYAGCKVTRAYDGRARKFKLTLKNRKADRARPIDVE